jgi:hypothetical protein
LSLLLDGTGLQPGQTYGCNLVGYEWDRVVANGATPPGLTILGASTVFSDFRQAEVSNTAYYTASSGAFVFASGSIYWSYALDNLRVWDMANAAPIVQANACLSQSQAVPGIQVLMAHVMSQMIISANG